MSKVNEVGHCLPERINVGLSSIIGVSAAIGQVDISIKLLAASGSLEIGGTYAYSGGTYAAFTWGNGYLLGTSEVLKLNMQGTFWLAATGATVTALIMRTQSPGVI